MDKKLNDRIEYVIAMISEFAAHHGMTPPQSFRYLQRFGGIEFIDKYYNVKQIGLRVTEGHMKTAVVRLAIMGINPGIKFLIRATH